MQDKIMPIHPITLTEGVDNMEKAMFQELTGQITGLPTVELSGEEWEKLALLWEYEEEYGSEGYRIMLLKVLSFLERIRLQGSGYTVRDIAHGRVPDSDWGQSFAAWNEKLGIAWWGN
jgi:hypothetical protein